MHANITAHYAKALIANGVRFAVSVALSLAASFAVLAPQLGGIGPAMARIEGWAAVLRAHVITRGATMEAWLAVSAAVVACICLFGPLLVFQFARWRHPRLEASAILPDQRRTLVLHLDAATVFVLLRDIVESDPTLARIEVDENGGRLNALSLPFTRYRATPEGAPVTAGGNPGTARGGLVRRALGRIDLPFIGGPRRRIAIDVAPRETTQADVTVRSQFATLLPVLDSCAQNRRTVEAIADALKARAPRLIAERRAQAERAALDRRLLDARLQVLRAQIEPHFLYNTLANVQYLIRNNPPAADAMIGELITYLRQSLPKMRDGESTVGGELALARAYLNVLRIRMGDRLGFTITAPAALEAHAFPPMMLMSLVENAIKHGLEPKAGAGKIAISVTSETDALRIEVRDDGVGFGAAAGGGIGLMNVRETLASMFGDRAHLVVEPNAGGGVTAAIEIPLTQNAGERPLALPA